MARRRDRRSGGWGLWTPSRVERPRRWQWRPRWTPGPSCRRRGVRCRLRSSGDLLSASCDDGDDVSECGQCVVAWEDATVFTEELSTSAGGHVPAAVGEIVRDVVSLALVELPRQVDIAADVGPSVAHRLAALGHRRTAVRVVLGGDLTAWGAERRDVVEQPVLRFRWQVHQ